jgi:hypothetical protein
MIIEYDCERCGAHVRKSRTPGNLKCIGVAQRDAGNPAWNGGRYENGDGYVFVFKPDHPYAHEKGTVLEHRLVMETILGRYLDPVEIVHHRNEIRNDNRPENLQLFPDQAAHLAEHRRIRRASHAASI